MAFTINPYIGGMPAAMAAALTEKYRQSNVQTNAQAAQAYSAAALNNQNAAMVRPLGQSQIALQSTQGNLNNANAYEARERGDMVKPLGYADIRYKNAAAFKLNEEGKVVRPLAEAGIYRETASGNKDNVLAGLGQSTQQMAAGDSKGKSTLTPLIYPAGMGGGGSTLTIMGAPPAAAPVDAGPSIAPTTVIQKSDSLVDSFLDTPSNFMAPIKPIFSEEEGMMRSAAKNALDPMKLYKRGTARVPGKGSGDKVPALLEPGEAILNKNAAKAIGRDKIAAANAKGNQQRQKQDTLKIAQMLKAMSSGMV